MLPRPRSRENYSRFHFRFDYFRYRFIIFLSSILVFVNDRKLFSLTSTILFVLVFVNKINTVPSFPCSFESFGLVESRQLIKEYLKIKILSTDLVIHHLVNNIEVVDVFLV